MIDSVAGRAKRWVRDRGGQVKMLMSELSEPTIHAFMMHNPNSRAFAQRLQHLRGLADLVENTLVQKANDLSARLAAEAEKLNAEERLDLYEYHADDYIEISDELPTLLRYSVLTACDAAFENYLNDTCETFAEVSSARVRLDDFSGRGIRRAREYLKKAAGIKFPDQTPIWVMVTRLHEIRNSIMHADGYVPPERAELYGWSGAIPGFRIGGTATITLDRDFTGAALDAYDKFAQAFDEACEPLSLWSSVFPVEDI